jgi:UDP-N-acetylmuramoyl-L-alanyl-D-glutamate--2,6-diaminopimelate ligase
MRLKDALPPGVAVPASAGDSDIRGITASSGNSGPGMIFAALPGAKTDGALYIPDAIARGVTAVIAGEGKALDVVTDVPILRVANPRRLLAQIAARLYAGQPQIAVAVTGTSGKTSVADFTRQLFTALGRQAASLGTIGLIKPGNAIYGSLTTPDPVTLHATLSELAKEGITHLAFEASSHGLDQHRLDGVRLTAAAFTNLGRDHMDYHPTVEDYLQAKLRLFTELLEPGQAAVVNADGAYAERVIEAARQRGLKVLTVGAAGKDLRRVSLKNDGFAQLMQIETAGKLYAVRLPLVGAYQVENALTAAGLVIATGEDVAAVLTALETLHGVPGRLEIIGEANGGLAIVDYAHKPEALAAALDACRPFATGKLICIFGCGGDRDKGKRPIMGEISVSKADVTIVTDDNPRSEEPAAIRAEILRGAKGAREIGDRAEAIRTAVGMMRKGDVVMVAGKGHETGQIIKDRVIPFSDHEALRLALDEVRHRGA